MQPSENPQHPEISPPETPEREASENNQASFLRQYSSELRWTLVVLILAGLAVVALWPQSQSYQQESALPAPGGPVASPPGPGTSATNGEVAEPATREEQQVLAGLAQRGQPTLVNVWASWCAPCRAELPVLQAYSQRPAAAPVLAVQVLSSAEDGQRFLAETGVRLPTVTDDARGTLRTALRVPPALPASFLVTPDRRVTRLPAVVFRSPEQVEQTVRTAMEAGT